jgi:hypothetical protein
MPHKTVQRKAAGQYKYGISLLYIALALQFLPGVAVAQEGVNDANAAKDVAETVDTAANTPNAAITDDDAADPERSVGAEASKPPSLRATAPKFDFDSEQGSDSVAVSATVEPPPKPPAPAVEPKPAPPKPAAIGHGKQIVAVYMAGAEPPGARGVHNILGGELARVLSESDRYTAVDRTEAILGQLDREHAYQRSGAVDDDQIKAIGHQLGVEYLCISNINPVGKRYYLDTRLVDVVTAEIVRSATATSKLKDANEMARVGRNIALELLEADKTRLQRARRKLFFRSTAISLDVLGLLAFTYGYIENNNVVKNVERVDEGNIKDGPEAERAATRRNAAYIVSGALIAAGVSIHIVF